MIDIHCHIIPNIDDGCRNITESIALLKIAATDGIRRMVCTPHIHKGRFDNNQDNIQLGLSMLKKSAKEEGIDIELAGAAEVRFDSEIIDLLENDTLPLYGELDGQHYMLLELPHSNIPPGATHLINYLQNKGIKPVIAHPERNIELLRNPEKITQFTNLGCWLQITAGSIIGQFGQRCHELAHYYLEQDMVNVVASDAHNIKHRPPLLSEAKENIAKLYGEQRAQLLFWQNPYDITETLFT